MECANDGFYLRNTINNQIVEVLEINQNEAGIDTENRVKKAIEWYEKIKNVHIFKS